jgi:hypothetical protein
MASHADDSLLIIWELALGTIAGACPDRIADPN